MPNKKPTLLLIHGFPLDRTLWDEQVHGLSDVAHVVAPDLCGFGNDTSTVRDVITMDDFAKDLKVLLDIAGVKKVVLCGLSMGGYIALAFLQHWPDRVQGLILANTKANADDAKARAGREHTARDAHEKGMELLARATVPKVLSAASRKRDPQLQVRISAMIARQHPAAVAAASLGMAQRPDRTGMLPTIEVPTLVITGSDDALMPLPTSQALVGSIPGARLAILPGAGHLTNVEAPAAFNTLLKEFLLAVASH